MLLARPPSGRRPPTGGRPGPALVPGPLGAALGFGAGVLVVLVAVPFADPATGLALAAAATVVVAATTTLRGALDAAAQCWAIWDGFLLDGLGRLGLAGGGGAALLTLLPCTVAAWGAAAAFRWAARGG